MSLPAKLLFPQVSYVNETFHLSPHPKITGDFYCLTHDDEIVSSDNNELWRAARRLGITASGFGELVKRDGTPSKMRKGNIERKVLGLEEDKSYLSVFKRGHEREPHIATAVHKRYGITPNNYLLSGANPRFLATPDGLSQNLIGEYKSSIKSWGQNVYNYYRQIQWQLFVTGRKKCLFAVEHPKTLHIMMGLVPRDPHEMNFLEKTALEVLTEIDIYASENFFVSPRSC